MDVRAQTPLMFNSVTDFPSGNQIELDAGPVSAAKIIRMCFNLQVDSKGRDQALLLIFNGDAGNNYMSLYDSASPFHHAVVGREYQNGLVIGYTGWGQDGDVLADVTVSLEQNRKRNLTGSAAVALGNSNQYAGVLGGAWLNRADPIQRISLILPNGGAVAGYVTTSQVA